MHSTALQRSSEELHTVACIYLLKIQSNNSLTRGVYTVSCLWLLNRLLLFTLVYLFLFFYCIMLLLLLFILFKQVNDITNSFPNPI